MKDPNAIKSPGAVKGIEETQTPQVGRMIPLTFRSVSVLAVSIK